ncbi:MAG TPA: methyltransferase domain-containing protein [Longimicrobium sp.]|nr:methyltransferase domain-containing protein [Longimicrobium sp.]
MSEEHEYLLGTDADELSRLGFQHQAWAAEAARAWEHGGFRPGSHVLDVGCGPGYGTLDLARLVGPSGRVVGVDVSARFIAHLQARIAAEGLHHVSVELQDVEALDLPAASFDGAFARWVLCFVKRPDAVVRGVAAALKPGGTFVVKDYSNYGALQVAPEHPVTARVVDAILASWRDSGGNVNVGTELPRLMVEAGMEVRSVEAISRVARPDSALWQWPRRFFDNYLPGLVERGYLARAELDEFNAVWAERSADPAAFFVTPPMVEVVAVRR